MLLMTFALFAGACTADDGEVAEGDDPADTTEAEADGDTGTEADGETDGSESDADGEPDGTESEETGGEPGTIRVPEDHDTIQAAVDAASEGDLILIAPGTYEEAVDVKTNDLVIRGLSRNEVILEGNFELENGIRVLGADGVAVENMTAQNYTKNGFFWTTEVDGWRGTHLTAIRNGDYGIYAFGAINGLITDSYGSGSPDASFYIGQCFPCNAVIDNVIGEWSGLGYSGTNAGGNLYIVNSTFRFNRAGIVPNSGNYEGCAPERESTVVGNIVYGNNNAETSAIGAAKLAQGNGILIAGGHDNLIARNLVWDHDVTGIGVVPFPEDNPVAPIPETPEVDCLTSTEPVPDYEEAQILWPPEGNQIVENSITDSREVDFFLVPLGEDHGNCVADNDLTTSNPADIATVVPCDGEAQPIGAEPAARFLEIALGDRPESVPFEEVDLPDPGPQPEMEDPENAPAEPAREPEYPDAESITLPERPADA